MAGFFGRKRYPGTSHHWPWIQRFQRANVRNSAATLRMELWVLSSVMRIRIFKAVSTFTGGWTILLLWPSKDNNGVWEMMLTIKARCRAAYSEWFHEYTELRLQEGWKAMRLFFYYRRGIEPPDWRNQKLLDSYPKRSTEFIYDGVTWKRNGVSIWYYMQAINA